MKSSFVAAKARGALARGPAPPGDGRASTLGAFPPQSLRW